MAQGKARKKFIASFLDFFCFSLIFSIISLLNTVLYSINYFFSSSCLRLISSWHWKGTSRTTLKVRTHLIPTYCRLSYRLSLLRRYANLEKWITSSIDDAKIVEKLSTWQMFCLSILSSVDKLDVTLTCLVMCYSDLCLWNQSTISFDISFR